MLYPLTKLTKEREDIYLTKSLCAIRFILKLNENTVAFDLNFNLNIYFLINTDGMFSIQ